MSVLYTAATIEQDETIDTLRGEGYDISERTLRHWRKIRILPPLDRIGNEWFYPVTILPEIREICIQRGRFIREVLTVYTIEGVEFHLIKVEVRRVKGRLKLFLFEEGGGFIVKEIEREQEVLDAFTRN